MSGKDEDCLPGVAIPEGVRVLYECAMCHRDRPLEEIAATTFREAEDRYFCEDGPSVRAAWYEHACRDCMGKKEQ